MLTRLQLQLPRLDLLLLCEGVCFQYTVYNFSQLPIARQLLGLALQAMYIRHHIVPIGVGLGPDFEFGDFARGLSVIAELALAGSSDSYSERVVEVLSMLEAVVSFTRTAAIEAVQADVKAGRIVDTVKASRAILAIHGFGGARWPQIGKLLHVWAVGHCGSHGRRCVCV